MIKTYCLYSSAFYDSDCEEPNHEKEVTCIGEGWLDIDEDDPSNFPSWTFYYEYDLIRECLHWDIVEIIRANQ